VIQAGHVDKGTEKRKRSTNRRKSRANEICFDCFLAAG
jgi:hypothetical protein